MSLLVPSIQFFCYSYLLMVITLYVFVFTIWKLNETLNVHFNFKIHFLEYKLPIKVLHPNTIDKINSPCVHISMAWQASLVSLQTILSPQSPDVLDRTEKWYLFRTPRAILTTSIILILHHHGDETYRRMDVPVTLILEGKMLSKSKLGRHAKAILCFWEWIEPTGEMSRSRIRNTLHVLQIWVKLNYSGTIVTVMVLCCNHIYMSCRKVIKWHLDWTNLWEYKNTPVQGIN